MQQDGNATTKPPDTTQLDSEWDELRPGEESGDDPEKDRDTALPPSAYEDFARQAGGESTLTGPEAKRALSAPSLPRIREPRDPMQTIPDTDLDDPSIELEAPIPTLGASSHVPSGPHAIPLEMDEPDPADQTLPIPVTAPTNVVMTPTSQVSSGRQPIVVEPGEPEWHDEVTMRDSRAPTVRGKRSAPPPAASDELPGPLEESLELALDGLGDAMDLVSARSTPLAPRSSDPLIELRDRYAVGDFTGALSIAEAVVGDDPGNTEASRYLDSCRDILTQMYTARLGSLSQIPRVALPAEELRWLTLDHRSGFLLSCIDGSCTVEDILDVSGMPPLDTLRILYTLMQQQIIEMTPSR